MATTDLNKISWAKKGSVKFAHESPDFHLFPSVLKKKIIKIDVVSQGDLYLKVTGDRNTYALFFIKNICIGKELLIIGENLVEVPYFDLFNNIQLAVSPNRSRSGTTTIFYSEPSTQIVINPLTNEPVLLGQESLSLIENFNKNYSEQVIAEISSKITQNVQQELLNIENKLIEISNNLNAI